jgi:hypothetical protein
VTETSELSHFTYACRVATRVVSLTDEAYNTARAVSQRTVAIWATSSRGVFREE